MVARALPNGTVKVNAAPVLLKTRYVNERANIGLGRYGNGRAAIALFATNGREMLMVPSVNLPEAPCGPEEVYIKEYSENAGVTAFLIENGIIERDPVGKEPSGFVVISRYRLTPAVVEILNKAKGVA